MSYKNTWSVRQLITTTIYTCTKPILMGARGWRSGSPALNRIWNQGIRSQGETKNKKQNTKHKTKNKMKKQKQNEKTKTKEEEKRRKRGG